MRLIVVLLLQINVDEHKNIAMRYNVSSIPHYAFISGGQYVDTITGAAKAELKKKLSQLK